MIVHYRIDSRVVHGQTTTKIMRENPIDGVIIIDDGIAADKVMLGVYKAAAGVKTLAFTEERALAKLSEAQASQKRYLVVFKTTRAARNLVERGAVFTGTLNVGPQPNVDGAMLVEKMLYLTPCQIEDLDALERRGVDLIINPAFTTSTLTWADAKAKAGVHS